MSTIQQNTNFIDKISQLYLIREIDKPLFICLLKSSTIVLTTLLLLLLPTYALYLFPIHLLLYLAFMGQFLTMFHDLMHHPLLKNKWLNQLLIGSVGTLYGLTHYTYFCHHVMMHHPEDNGSKDLSSTRPYQRDSFRDFLSYHFHFFFGLFRLSVFIKSHKNRLRIQYANRMVFYELLYLFFGILLLVFNPIAALAIVFIPIFISRTMLIIGNWAEHAFINPDNPDNTYNNTANILGKYNKDCFNVGYHIGHHLHPAMHFSLMAAEFDKNIERYAKEDAIVFKDVHYPHIWYYLMTKNYKKLASLFVQLPGRVPRSEAEIIALLQQRVVAIPESVNTPANHG
jgi:fatty acid desaturase